MWPENEGLGFRIAKDGDPKQWQGPGHCFWGGRLKRSEKKRAK